MRSAEQVAAKLRESGFTDEVAKQQGHADVEEALVWWLALQQADQMNADWGRKEWATYIKGGHYPLTLEDITEEIQARHSTVEEERDDALAEHSRLDTELGQELMSFFDMELCPGCGKEKPNVKERYSFGIYAGNLCVDCCGRYKDRCGLGGRQGNQNDLEERIDPL